MNNTHWSPTVKIFAAALLLIGALFLVYSLRVLIPPLGAAVLLASILRVPVNYLERRTGLPRALLTLLTFIVVIILLALTPALIAPHIAQSVGELRLYLTDVVNVIRRIAQRPIALGPFGQVVPLEFLAPAVESIQGMLTPLAGGIVVFAGKLASGIAWGLFITVVTFWLVKDYPHMFRYFRRLFPSAYQAEIARLGREIANAWNAFLKGEFILSLVVGSILSIALWILGMPTPILLGMFSGFMEFVPTLGPLLAWSMAVSLALLQGSSWLPVNHFIFALIVTGVYLLVFQLDSVFLIPRIVGRRVQLHPLVVFIGLIAGAMLGGVVGVLLAAPTIASLRVLVRYVYHKLLDLPPFPPETPLLAPGDGWWQPERARDVQLILFDLDGTLFETDDSVVRTLAHWLQPLARLLEFDAQKAARRLVMGLEGWVNGLVTFLDVLHLDRIAFALAQRADHLLHGDSHTKDQYQLTDHARTLLEDLRGRYRLGVVTTRSREEAERMLNAVGIRDLFDVIITRDDTRRLKPHPAPIRLAAERLNIPVENVLMVGDTQMDVRAAKAAGALSAAVLCGFGEIEELQDADIILNTPAELWRWLP